MSDFISTLILAVIQGLSEWFPISSSGHLVLFSKILGFQNTVPFDVALHFGTLMAVFVYFGKDIVIVIEDILKGRWKTENARLGFLLIVASIPVAFFGFIFKKIFESSFDSLWIVAVGFAITSMALFIASLNFRENQKKIPSYKDAWIIGFAQVVSIFPGVSRSGSTISSGLIRGLTPRNALKFSFLMSIPAIFGASILEIGSTRLPSAYILPTILAFLVGMLTIHILLNFVGNSRKNLRWFAFYDLILAIVLISYLAFY